MNEFIQKTNILLDHRSRDYFKQIDHFIIDSTPKNNIEEVQSFRGAVRYSYYVPCLGQEYRMKGKVESESLNYLRQNVE